MNFRQATNIKPQLGQQYLLFIWNLNLVSSILLVHSILREELHIQKKKKILSWIPKGGEREMGVCVWQSQKAVEKSAAPSHPSFCRV